MYRQISKPELYSRDMRVIDPAVDRTPLLEVFPLGSIIENTYEHPRGVQNRRRGEVIGYARWYEGAHRVGGRLYKCRYIDPPKDGDFMCPVDHVGNVKLVKQ